MKRFMRALPAAAVIWAGLFGSVRADVFSYGDYVGNTVQYVNVRETTDDAPSGATEGLFGRPGVFADSLDFDSISFGSTSEFGGSDVETASTLSVEIGALSGYTIGVLKFREAGDYTLLGFGTSDTSAVVTANFDINIVDVDGSELSTPINLNVSMDLTPSDGDYDLDNDYDEDNPGLVAGIWEGTLNVNLTEALINAGQPFVSGVTRVNVDLTNVLTATSESGTQTLIAKKDFGGTSISVVIPLPSSVAIGLLGMAGIVLLGWKQRTRVVS